MLLSIYVLLSPSLVHDRFTADPLYATALKAVGTVGIYWLRVVKLYVAFTLLFPSVALTHQLYAVLYDRVDEIEQFLDPLVSGELL